MARGESGRGYPYPWLVYPWLPGISLDRMTVDDLARDGRGLVRASPCRGSRPTGLRDQGAGAVRWPRSIGEVEWAIGNLEGVVDTARAREVWRVAREAESPSMKEVWVHGDLLPGNILAADGRLSGIIDWSATGVGDPACDAMFAWTSAAARTEPSTAACSDSTTRRGPAPAAGWWSRPPCTSRITRRRCRAPWPRPTIRLEAALSDEH